MSQFDPNSYGPVFAPLLEINRRRSLDAGTPDAAARGAFDAMAPDTAFAHTKVVDRDMAACCLAGVWLLHDYLAESHAISQHVATPSGILWHAIMHRREGDYSNAKYWLGQAGRHPVFDAIGQRAAELAAERGAEKVVKKLIQEGTWDACAFVDLCEDAVRGESDATDLCRDIQQAEWELLFDSCYRAAVG